VIYQPKFPNDPKYLEAKSSGRISVCQLRRVTGWGGRRVGVATGCHVCANCCRPTAGCRLLVLFNWRSVISTWRISHCTISTALRSQRLWIIWQHTHI